MFLFQSLYQRHHHHLHCHHPCCAGNFHVHPPWSPFQEVLLPGEPSAKSFQFLAPSWMTCRTCLSPNPVMGPCRGTNTWPSWSQWRQLGWTTPFQSSPGSVGVGCQGCLWVCLVISISPCPILLPSHPSTGDGPKSLFNKHPPC